MASIRENAAIIRDLRGELSIATSPSFLRENEERILEDIKALKSSLLVIYPSRATLFNEEIALFSAEVSRVFSEEKPNVSPSRSLYLNTMQPTIDLKKLLYQVLFELEVRHLKIIEKACSPKLSKRKKSKAISAKNNLSHFLASRIKLQEGERLTKLHFADVSFEDLEQLQELLVAVYNASSQKEKKELKVILDSHFQLYNTVRRQTQATLPARSSEMSTPLEVKSDGNIDFEASLSSTTTSQGGGGGGGGGDHTSTSCAFPEAQGPFQAAALMERLLRSQGDLRDISEITPLTMKEENEATVAALERELTTN